jgi:hypothetical protein
VRFAEGLIGGDRDAVVFLAFGARLSWLFRQGQAEGLSAPPGMGEEPVRPVMTPYPGQPGPVSIPHTVCLPVWAGNPAARAQNVRNGGAVNSGSKTASSDISDAGSDTVGSGSIGARFR